MFLGAKVRKSYVVFRIFARKIFISCLMRLSLLVFSFLLLVGRAWTQPAPCPDGTVLHCSAADSAEVERLLRLAAALPDSVCRPLFFARQFVGRPYVGGTLDRPGRERLVVRLQGFDCTTLVETVAALTLADRHGQRSLAGFAEQLRRLRYEEGRVDYVARQHYFSWWIDGNARRGVVEEIAPPDCFTGRQKLHLDYMSHHPGQYAALRHNPGLTDSIRRREVPWRGRTVRFLPSAALAADSLLRGTVRDGDILATVSRRPGLDVNHVGLAVWGRDGRLHLLNASSLRHRVVEERWTLAEYLRRQKSVAGLRVVRLR